MEQEVHVMENCVNIDRWFYKKTSMESEENGEIILLFQYCMGPLEWCDGVLNVSVIIKSEF